MNWIRNAFRKPRSLDPALEKMITPTGQAAAKTLGDRVKDLATGTAIYGGLGAGLTAFDYSGYNPLTGSAEFIQEAGPMERTLTGLTNTAGAYGLAHSLRKGKMGWAGGTLLGLLGNAPLLRHAANVSDLTAKTTESTGNVLDKVERLDEGLRKLLIGDPKIQQGWLKYLKRTDLTPAQRLQGEEAVRQTTPFIESVAEAAGSTKQLSDHALKSYHNISGYAKPVGLGLGGAALGALASSYLSDPVLPGDTKEEARKKIYANRLNSVISALTGGLAGVGGSLLYDRLFKTASQAAYPGYQGATAFRREGMQTAVHNVMTTKSAAAKLGYIAWLHKQAASRGVVGMDGNLGLEGRR